MRVEVIDMEQTKNEAKKYILNEYNFYGFNITFIQSSSFLSNIS